MPKELYKKILKGIKEDISSDVYSDIMEELYKLNYTSLSPNIDKMIIDVTSSISKGDNGKAYNTLKKYVTSIKDPLELQKFHTLSRKMQLREIVNTEEYSIMDKYMEDNSTDSLLSYVESLERFITSNSNTNNKDVTLFSALGNKELEEIMLYLSFSDYITSAELISPDSREFMKYITDVFYYDNKDYNMDNIGRDVLGIIDTFNIYKDSLIISDNNSLSDKHAGAYNFITKIKPIAKYVDVSDSKEFIINLKQLLAYKKLSNELIATLPSQREDDILKHYKEELKYRKNNIKLPSGTSNIDEESMTYKPRITSDDLDFFPLIIGFNNFKKVRVSVDDLESFKAYCDKFFTMTGALITKEQSSRIADNIFNLYDIYYNYIDVKPLSDYDSTGTLERALAINNIPLLSVPIDDTLVGDRDAFKRELEKGDYKNINRAVVHNSITKYWADFRLSTFEKVNRIAPLSESIDSSEVNSKNIVLACLQYNKENINNPTYIGRIEKVVREMLGKTDITESQISDYIKYTISTYKDIQDDLVIPKSLGIKYDTAYKKVSNSLVSVIPYRHLRDKYPLAYKTLTNKYSKEDIRLFQEEQDHLYNNIGYICKSSSNAIEHLDENRDRLKSAITGEDYSANILKDIAIFLNSLDCEEARILECDIYSKALLKPSGMRISSDLDLLDNTKYRFYLGLEMSIALNRNLAIKELSKNITPESFCKDINSRLKDSSYVDMGDIRAIRYYLQYYFSCLTDSNIKAYHSLDVEDIANEINMSSSGTLSVGDNPCIREDFIEQFYTREFLLPSNGIVATFDSISYYVRELDNKLGEHCISAIIDGEGITKFLLVNLTSKILYTNIADIYDIRTLLDILEAKITVLDNYSIPTRHTSNGFTESLLYSDIEQHKIDNIEIVSPYYWKYRNNYKSGSSFAEHSPVTSTKEIVVSAFVRRLPNGGIASKERQDLARRYCIKLEEGYTIVDSFTRKSKESESSAVANSFTIK